MSGKKRKMRGFSLPNLGMRAGSEASIRTLSSFDRKDGATTQAEADVVLALIACSGKNSK